MKKNKDGLLQGGTVVLRFTYRIQLLKPTDVNKKAHAEMAQYF